MKRKSKEPAAASKLAIVQIAMMIAGLDGVISPEEYVAFEDILESGGCQKNDYENALERGLESAGYIVLQSQRLEPEALMAVFVKKAACLLSGGLADLRGDIARRAFMFWIIMAVSDNNYSSIERNGILALKKAAEECTRESIVSENYLEKCERMAYKLAAAQHVYAIYPTTMNKNRCRSILRRIGNLIKEDA